MLKRAVKHFLNQSLRVKILSIWLGMIIILQCCSAMVFQAFLSRDYEALIAKSKLETLKQVSYNLNQNFYDIVEKMIDIRDDVQTVGNRIIDTPNDYFNNHVLYERGFNQLAASGNNYRFIASMLVLDNENTHYFSLEHSNYQRKNSITPKFREKYALEGSCIWNGTVSSRYPWTGDSEEQISILMPVYNYQDIQAVLIVNLNVKKLSEYLKELTSEGDFIILKTEEEGGFITIEGSESVLKTGAVEEVLRKDSPGSIENVDHYLVVSDQMEINKWNLYLVYDKQTGGSRAVVPVTIMVAIVITGILTFFLGYFVVWNITKPLNKLTRIMAANRGRSGLNERFPHRYQDEIGVMVDAYNQMMDEMQLLVRDIEQEQMQNKKNYLKLLQLQIKPHFLYNSLEATRFLVEMQDPKANDMISAIGRFYKLSLSGVKDIVRLDEEMEYLTCYLTILKIRYSSKYDYEIRIPEGMGQLEIVKFTLQPLVENAIYHGVKHARKKGLVRISAEVTAENLMIEIWDNGKGISKEKLEEIQAEIKNGEGKEKVEHIGMVNVHQRIRMYYSQSYGITVDSEEGVYTSVKVTLPARQYHGEEGERNDV